MVCLSLDVVEETTDPDIMQPERLKSVVADVEFVSPPSAAEPPRSLARGFSLPWIRPTYACPEGGVQILADAAIRYTRSRQSGV
jgi:hypothetical protein